MDDQQIQIDMECKRWLTTAENGKTTWLSYQGTQRTHSQLLEVGVVSSKAQHPLVYKH